MYEGHKDKAKGRLRKAKGKRQRAKGKNEIRTSPKGFSLPLLPFAFCLLPFAFTVLPSLYGVAVGHGARDDGFGNELAVHLRFAAHALEARADAQGCHFEHERIAGHDGLAKARRFDAGKEHELALAVFEFAHRKDRADLR